MPILELVIPKSRLNARMADCHRRKVDLVLVWKFDRFARSTPHLLRALETFEDLGIEFVSISEQIDTSTAAGKMIFTVLGAVAALERSLIAERTRLGISNARKQGKRIGRPPIRKLTQAEVVKVRADRPRRAKAGLPSRSPAGEGWWGWGESNSRPAV